MAVDQYFAVLLVGLLEAFEYAQWLLLSAACRVQISFGHLAWIKIFSRIQIFKLSIAHLYAFELWHFERDIDLLHVPHLLSDQTESI